MAKKKPFSNRFPKKGPWTVLEAPACEVIQVTYKENDQTKGIAKVLLRHYSFDQAKEFFVSKSGKLIRISGDSKWVINGVLEIPSE